MEIFSRSPIIAEDTLQYAIYPPPNLSDKVSLTSFAACIRAFIDTLLQGFIWHRDSFEIKLVEDPDSDGWMLEGTMRVGDSVDDEWYTVWLLKEMSSKWDVVISVFDSDGEFLLIEAAEALPAWVKPTNSENRVWIYNSRLHLIPLSYVSPPSSKRHRRKLPGFAADEEPEDIEESEWISAKDAVQIVRSASFETFAPPEVEKLVWDRISVYPAAAKSHVHKALAYIPFDIAKALAAKPYLVQKAAETFYTRDAIQLRAAHRMLRFSPETSVLRPVQMTRTAYAQLVGQKFFPPKIFGRWQEKEGTKEWRWRDVGMKIAVGFEILFQESKGKPSASNTSSEGVQSSSEANKEALRRSPDYQTYIQNLVSADYFKGETEGSQLWKALENKAAETYVDVRRTDDANRQSFASQVNVALAEIQNLPEGVILEEDEDQWLNIDSNDFDQMLERTLGSSKAKAPQSSEAMDVDIPEIIDSIQDRVASDQAARLKVLASRVENFVEGEGGLDGALFDDEEPSDDSESFPDEEDEQSSEEEEPADPSVMDSVERQEAMDKLVAGLDPGDYGQMPASFHSNSQRVASTTVATDSVEEVNPKEANAAEETKIKSKPIREPILPRDKYDGVDSDDETDEDEMEENDESEEDRPQVVGDIEIDMGEEEEEFLEFSRQALGITEAHWNQILDERKDRGAFIPLGAKPKSSASSKVPVSAEKSPATAKPEESNAKSVNPNLDSFEAVMRAMDEQLSHKRPGEAQARRAKPPNDKGKGKEQSAPADEDNIEASMDAELKATLSRDDGMDEDDEEEPMDYNLIKNFLESFKSQAGLSGPVSNLAGRLQPEWRLPRDEGS